VDNALDHLKVVPVESGFWGKGIGVAGLLTGGDFIQALKGNVHGDFVVLPSVDDWR
jgi:NifB/MoaA-like Fe-S oxidoreductase